MACPQLLHTIAKVVRLKVPYVSSFLSLREAEPLLELLDTARRTIPNDMPQFIFVDGNGRLHQRQAGLATVVGVRSGCPTIGIGKDYYPIMSDERVIPEIHPALSSHADAALGSQPLGATFPGNFRASQKGFKAVCRQTLKKTGDWIGIYGRDGREYVGGVVFQLCYVDLSELTYLNSVGSTVLPRQGFDKCHLRVFRTSVVPEDFYSIDPALLPHSAGSRASAPRRRLWSAKGSRPVGDNTGASHLICVDIRTCDIKDHSRVGFPASTLCKV